MIEIAEGIGKSFNVELDLKIIQGGYLPVENNPQLADELMDFFEKLPDVNLINIDPAMTGEDFGYLLSKISGVMFWLGIDSPAALHSNQMNPNEGALKFAVENISKFLEMKGGTEH